MHNTQKQTLLLHLDRKTTLLFDKKLNQNGNGLIRVRLLFNVNFKYE